MSKVMVGLVGCGFVAELHMYAYKRVYGIEAEVIAVAARGDHVFDFAKKHKIRKTYRDFRDLIDDGEVDVVDICTPPALHAAMIVDAVRAEPAAAGPRVYQEQSARRRRLGHA